MKMPEKRCNALYAAIREPIVDLRMELERTPARRVNLDARLFRLEQAIWTHVRAALELEEVT